MVKVGVIGGGQLAWMMAPAAQTLGLELWVQTPDLSDPVGMAIFPQNMILAPINDADATAILAKQCDVVTFENEFVDLHQLAPLAQADVQFYPRLRSLQPLLDKYHQRQCFQQLGIPTPAFELLDTGRDAGKNMPAKVGSPNSTQSWAESLGQSWEPRTTVVSFPMALKARRHGYDGKGTYIVKTAAELTAILTSQPDTPWLIEEFVPFERELAVMAARSVNGDILVYPVVETQQEHQVCRRVFMVPGWDQGIQQQVEAITHTLLTHLDFVGVLGIEFFLTADGRVLVNEVAPRTHNSGHHTIDACVTSQFEQQLRAVTGLPLGPVHPTCAAAVMVNLLGYEESEHSYQAQRDQLAALPQTQVYWYGKSVCHPGRKMGHVTAIIPNNINDTSDTNVASDTSDTNVASDTNDHPEMASEESEILRQRLVAIATRIEQIWDGSG
ncbi:MAG: 5-(carboxyamino)imidazole ribonucleotide synthase [Cyanothece sp. SIO2G6]|nr:5-(carboxyamino)imidazole ribonucleotide synthase [Cyanothece sp. SIO2G6]